MTTTVNPADRPSSEIIQRMIDDMMIRHLAPATIKCYANHIKKFAEFLDKSLDQATTADIRGFQLHLIQSRKLSWSSFNQAVCSLRFLYNITLPRPWPVAMIPFGKKAKRLPTVLSREEVEALLKCTRNRKHRTILITLYATGLRIMAREGKVTGGEREQVPITLSAVEFTRRWSLHILPKGYTKSRRFGGWGNPRKGECVERCAMLLEGVDARLTPEALSFNPTLFEQDRDCETDAKQPQCPHCGAAMCQTAVSLKPSWHDVMNSSHRPNWYSHIRPRL